MAKDYLISMMAIGLLGIFFGVYQPAGVYGGEMTNEMKQMQEQLNKEVLSKPFSVADEAKVKAYIEGAQRRGEVPPPYKRCFPADS